MSTQEHRHPDIILPQEWGSLPDRRLVFAQHLEAHGMPPWKPEDDLERQLCVEFLLTKNSREFLQSGTQKDTSDQKDPAAATTELEQQNGSESTSPVIDELERTGALNGISLEELEERMRPGEMSDSGFLGKNERLLDVLREDQATVDRLGVTHKEIARVLKEVVGFGYGKYEGHYKGRTYQVNAEMTFGFQDSPFTGSDRTKIEYDPNEISDGTDFFITDTETGEEISFGGLVIFLIEKYGFYEGKDTRYRLSPDKIVEFFRIK